MKKPYNHRFEEADVDNWKLQADKENRSLTNFIETVVNNYVLNVRGEKIKKKKGSSRKLATKR